MTSCKEFWCYLLCGAVFVIPLAVVRAAVGRYLRFKGWGRYASSGITGLRVLQSFPLEKDDKIKTDFKN